MDIKNTKDFNDFHERLKIDLTEDFYSGMVCYNSDDDFDCKLFYCETYDEKYYYSKDVFFRDDDYNFDSCGDIIIKTENDLKNNKYTLHIALDKFKYIYATKTFDIDFNFDIIINNIFETIFLLRDRNNYINDLVKDIVVVKFKNSELSLFDFLRKYTDDDLVSYSYFNDKEYIYNYIKQLDGDILKDIYDPDDYKKESDYLYYMDLSELHLYLEDDDYKKLI